MLHGIDVSSYQGATPDLTACDIVAIKVTEGTDYTNPNFQSQLDDARAHGSRVIFYHYPHITQNLQVQVTHFLSSIGPRLVENDVLCLDWEWGGQVVTDLQARTFKDEFISALQTACKNRIVVYCDLNNWKNVDQNSNVADGLWIADYASPEGEPDIQHAWFGHQYTDKPEDQDVWNFASLASFDSWARSNKTPAVPADKKVDNAMYSESFEIGGQGGGIHFARGIAKNVSFFCDNTLLLGTANLGVDLRVVIWEDEPATYHVQTIRVTNNKESTIDFPNPAKTHSVTVTRADSNTIPVYAEVSN